MRLIIFIFALWVHMPTAIAIDDNQKLQVFNEAYIAYIEARKTEAKPDIFKAAKAAFTLGRQIYGDNSKKTTILSINYSIAALQALEEKEASNSLHLTEKFINDTFGEYSTKKLSFFKRVAIEYLSHPKKIKQADKYFNKAIKLTRKLYGRQHIEEAIFTKTYGLESLIRAVYDREVFSSIDILRDAMDLFENLESQNSLNITEIQFLIGQRYWHSYSSLGNVSYNNTVKALEHALAIYNTNSETTEKAIETHKALVRIHSRQTKAYRATPHCLAIGANLEQTDTKEALLIYIAPPKHFSIAHSQKKKGDVIIEFEVDAKGFTRNPVIIETSGHSSYRSAALKALENFRFAPRFENGQAVKTKSVKYHFKFGPTN